MNIREKIKENIPKALFPLIREIRYRINGIPETEKALKREALELSQSWKNRTQRTKIPECSEEGLRLLFVTGYGVGTSYLTIEPAVMMNMRMRGHKILSLYCGKSLPSCEYNIVGNNLPDAGHFKKGLTSEAIEYTCNKCVSNLLENYRNLPTELHAYSEYLVPSDYDKANEIAESVSFKGFREFKYNEIAVGEEVYSSILRATFKGMVPETEDNRFLVKRYLTSGILTTIAMEKAFSELKPDRVIMIHGVYQTHGLPPKVAKKMGIPSVVMGGGGIRKNTVVMCHGETYHLQLVHEDNSLWENYELSKSEIEKTLKYSKAKRHKGAGVDYLNYHPNPKDSVSDVLAELNFKDTNKKIVTAYTNVAWDAQIFYNGNAFKNIFEWIQVSIEEFSKRKSVNFVIRIHPGEVKSGNPSLQPMEKEIEKMFPVLPDNVYVVPPESDICSYTLADISDVCIIYGTKMGLELALMKKKLIVCGETFSRNKGYGIDVKSIDDYKQIVENVLNLEIDLNYTFDRAVRYAHYFYFRRMLDLPIDAVGGGKVLNFESFHEFMDSKSLNVIAKGIEELVPFSINERQNN